MSESLPPHDKSHAELLRRLVQWFDNYDLPMDEDPSWKALVELVRAAASAPSNVEHKQGCPALGGYGTADRECICAPSTTARSTLADEIEAVTKRWARSGGVPEFLPNDQASWAKLDMILAALRSMPSAIAPNIIAAAKRTIESKHDCNEDSVTCAEEILRRADGTAKS